MQIDLLLIPVSDNIELNIYNMQYDLIKTGCIDSF